MRSSALLLLLLAGCGKKDETKALDEAYNAFKYRNFILGSTFGGGRNLDGTINLDASREGGGAQDWIEIAINGDVLGRTTGSHTVQLQVKFRPGPNKVSFFISSARRFWDYDVNARHDTNVDITPREAGDWTVDIQYGE